MPKITYSISNSGEPAKVFLGMMDRLLSIIILQDKQKRRIKKGKPLAFLLQCF